MLSFESSTSVPEGKFFFLGALAGLAKTGVAKAGIARAGVAKAGIARAGVVKTATNITKAPIKSLGGVTISPNFQKNDSKSYDYSTNNTFN